MDRFQLSYINLLMKEIKRTAKHNDDILVNIQDGINSLKNKTEHDYLFDELYDYLNTKINHKDLTNLEAVVLAIKNYTYKKKKHFPMKHLEHDIYPFIDVEIYECKENNFYNESDLHYVAAQYVLEKLLLIQELPDNIITVMKKYEMIEN